MIQESRSFREYFINQLYLLPSELLCSVQLYYHKRIVVACSTAGVAIAVYNSLLDNVGMFSLSLAETSSVQANKFNRKGSND